MLMQRKYRLILWVIVLVLSTPIRTWAESGLTFGVNSANSAATSQALWQPITDDLSRQLGRQVSIKISADYAGVIHGMQNGQIDVAWMGNESAVKAVDNAGAEIFAKFVFPSGRSEYFSFLIANSKLPLYTEKDVFEKALTLTLGLGDVNSTSGSLIPTYFLFNQNKINPRSAFKSGIRSNHEQNILAVAAGKIDVATVASNVYDRLCKSNPDIEANTRVVWQSPPIPSDPLLWSSTLPSDARMAVRDFFLSYGKERNGKDAKKAAAEKMLLDKLGAREFVASDNSQLQAIRLVEAFRSSVEPQ